MFLNLAEIKIYLKPGITDMRKSINGLSLIVQEVMLGKPNSSDLYFFLNRRRNIIKGLYWNKNGFCLWQKRLEKDKFPWSKSGENSSLEITEQELVWLLDGVDFFNRHENLTFSQMG